MELTPVQKAIREGLKKDRTSHLDLGRFPIAPGMTWTVHDHTVSCLDLEQDADEFLALTLGRVDMVYVDPPWGKGLYTGFQSKAGKGGGDYDRFRHELCRVLAMLGEPTILEMGNRWVNPWEDALESAGLPVVGFVGGTYYGNRPMTYIVAGPWGQSFRDVAKALAETDDFDAPLAVLEAIGKRGFVVCDPCCGRGNTAVSAAIMGNTFIGNELAPYRAAATLANLHALATSDGA